jgi:hypothetical protein
MRLKTLILAGTALLMSACAPFYPGPEGVPRMGVRTFFGPDHVCSLGISPPIELDRSPANAALYRVRYTKVSVLIAPSFEYETTAATPGRIAEGSYAEYRGPCVGETSTSQYRVEVLALDANGRSLAYGFLVVAARNPGVMTRGPVSERPRMPRPPEETRR